MEKRMKGFTCCGDCIHYNWKKHKCSLGASIETNAKDHFYDDCPLPDVVEGKVEEIRAKAIDEFAEMVELEILSMLTSKREYRIAKSTLDEIAEQLKGSAK